MLPYACGPAEAGCTESRGYTHLGPPGTVLAAGQAWERQKQKTRSEDRHRNTRLEKAAERGEDREKEADTHAHL